jgi:pimeloyl-ACP methyl ester carboxylesterase
VTVSPATDAVLELDVEHVPAADPAAEPQGFVVQADDETRLHFLDWGGPLPGALLIHGIAQTAWTWTPVARRLRAATRVVAMDLRGHGLSEAPTTGWDADTLAADAIAVADGAGLLEAGPVVLAGHGFGAIVAAWVAAVLGDRVAGLVLVDGGWEDVAAATDLSPEEFLRGLDEPPEVLRSMEAFLADRRDFDPATWDADQEQAARATVVEAHSKRLTPSTRPHAVTGAVEAMFEYDPSIVLPTVAAPILALKAADDEEGTHAQSLAAAQRALAAAGRPSIRVATFPDAGHNLMRYRPQAVAAAILALTGTL